MLVKRGGEEGGNYLLSDLFKNEGMMFEKNVAKERLAWDQCSVN